MKISPLHIIFTTLLILSGPSARALDVGTELDPLIVTTKILPFAWSPGQGGNIEIKMSLPSEFHAYEDKFELKILEPEGFKIAPLKIVPLVKWHDKFSKRERSGVTNKATLSAMIEAPMHFYQRHEIMKLQLTYQACTDQFCLFPTQKNLEVPILVNLIEGQPEFKSGPAQPALSTTSFFDVQNFQRYLGMNLLAGLFFVFLAGIFTSFTPCIFPMIPITLAVLGNHSNERSRLENFITSCIYVLGIATTYSLLGLIAASTGGLFGATLGNPIALAIICAIFLAMALSMYGLFEIQVPAFLRNSLGRNKQKNNVFGAYLTGLFAGVVASPCVGPILVAILTFVASTQNKVLGLLYLFTYALGLGLIFIILGLSNQLSGFLPRSGHWMNFFKFVLGTLMLSAFYYYLNLLIPARWFDLALGIGLILLASVYGAFGPTKTRKALEQIRKGTMLAVLIVGLGHVVLGSFDLRPFLYAKIQNTSSINQINQMNWLLYSDELLEQAKKENKPVIIDFWAEWCAACHELADHTFTDPRVRALGANFLLLKFDATQHSEKLTELKKRYKIRGLPTLIFISPNGVWNDALTLTEFEPANKFTARLEKALK
jgi:thiol:disulfide interchange protein DsbD